MKGRYLTKVEALGLVPALRGSGVPVSFTCKLVNLAIVAPSITFSKTTTQEAYSHVWSYCYAEGSANLKTFSSRLSYFQSRAFQFRQHPPTPPPIYLTWSKAMSGFLKNTLFYQLKYVVNLTLFPRIGNQCRKKKKAPKKILILCRDVIMFDKI